MSVVSKKSLSKFLSERQFAVVHIDAPWDGYRAVVEQKISAVRPAFEESVSFGYADNSGTGTVFSLSLLPQLAIMPSGANLILSWTTNAIGFTLQSTTNLGPSAIWTTNSPAPVVVNGLNTVTNPIVGTQQFFRLSQ
jgi:hypothetical protein